MVIELKIFRGWTIDERLRQFRKVYFNDGNNPQIEFIDFESEKGREILRQMVADRIIKSE